MKKILDMIGEGIIAILSMAIIIAVSIATAFFVIYPVLWVLSQM